jgi:hypothetical protein
VQSQGDDAKRKPPSAVETFVNQKLLIRSVSS